MDDQPSSPETLSVARKLMRGAGRNLGWMLASRSVLAILSLIYLGIATRALGVADFGRFALITGASQALTLFVGCQTWQIVVQYGVAHLASGDEQALGRLMRLCGLLDFCSAMVGAALSVVIVLLFRGALGLTPDMVLPVTLFAVVQLLCVRSTALGMLRLRDKFSLAAVADSVTPATRFVGALLALLVAPTVTGFLTGWAAAEILTAAAYWIFVRRSGDLGLMWRARLDRHLITAENPGVTRFAISTNVSSSLGLSSKQIPLLLVGAYVGPAAAGAFRLAFQLAQALTKLSQLLARAAFPEIVRAVHATGKEGLRSLLGRLLLGATVAAGFILVIVTFLGRPILVLVGGHAYAQAYPILLWLAVAGCMDLATTGFEPILMAIHRAGTASVARAAATVVLLALMVVLTPVHGAIGAAASVLAGSLATAILLGLAAFRFVGRSATA